MNKIIITTTIHGPCEFLLLLFGCVRLFATPWTTAGGASLFSALSRQCSAIQPSRPLPSPSPWPFGVSQHQGLLEGVLSSRQVATVFELQLQDLSFQ